VEVEHHPQIGVVVDDEDIGHGHPLPHVGSSVFVSAVVNERSRWR
jgi:hypothetical protein